MGERLRVGQVLCWAYLAVVVAWMAYQFVARPATSELAGVGVVVLALPWSLVVLPLAMMLGGVASLVVIIAGIVGGIVLNAWLLYRIGRPRASTSIVSGEDAAKADE